MSVAAIKIPEKIIDKNYCDTQGLLKDNPVYKPFRYPWCYDAWLTQQRIHWLPEEVPLSEDIRDWQKKLTQSEKNLLTQIFRFFTQADVEVNNCYLRHYTSVFKPTEFPKIKPTKTPAATATETETPTLAAAVAAPTEPLGDRG